VKRGPRGPRLTEAGRTYHAEAARIVADARRLEEATSEARATPRGTLRIAAHALLGELDFTAEGCAPCRSIARLLEALAPAYAGRLKVATLDVGRHPATAERFSVRSMPTLLFFKEGRVVRQLVGSISRGKIEEAIRAVA
jgi:thioredoxin 1